MHLATLVATAKNEGPFFWEWVAWHRSIGFEKIVIFQNDSDDLTHAILKCLEKTGAIRYFYNEAAPNKHQIRAYQRSTQAQDYKDAAWIMALDIDEFMVIKTGDGTLTALFEAVPSCDAILANWRLFGSSGQTEMTDGLVTDRFLYAEPKNRILTNSAGIKTLFRRTEFRRPGVHVPIEHDGKTNLRYVNGSGLTKDEFTFDNWRSMDPRKREFVQINHYMIKDPQSFVVKSGRGRAHQIERSVDKSYWRKHNFNNERDLAISRYRNRLLSEMKALNDATDGQLSNLTQRSQARHLQRFNELREDDDFKSLYRFCHAKNNAPEE